MAIHGDTRSVNIKRTTLLEKLKENLAIHKQDYIEAVEGYKNKLLTDLSEKLKEVEGLTADKLKDLKPVTFYFPENYERQYLDVIEMMEMSVDDTINLDSTSFKQYIKNEWSWSRGFTATTALYKTYNNAG